MHPLDKRTARGGPRAVAPPMDGRTRALTVTPAGRALLGASRPHWERAQRMFEETYGAVPADDLRRAAARLAETV